MTLKTLLLLLVLTCCGLGVTNATAQTKKAPIEGMWMSEPGSFGHGLVKIYQRPDGSISGQIVQLSMPTHPDGKPVTDVMNPNPALRSRKVVGLEILKGFMYDPANMRWEMGMGYDPASGKSYSCYIQLLPDGRLKLRGYVGYTWVGKNTYWMRAS